jgi:CubicO group peptidase (beta-lactamase class C family)
MFDTRMSRRSLLAAAGAGAASTLASCGANAADWTQLDKLLADAVAAKDAPFLIAAVSDRKGVLWQGAAGQATPTLKASQDVVCHLYSCTKAIGSLAVMILLDRGKVSLDTNVADVLPEFAGIPSQVLESMGPAGPVYRAPASPVKLRHLLTHTSGLAYNVWEQRELDWETFFNTPAPNGGTMKGFTHPLMFDPGTAWTYGVGMDWAGFLVEKIDGRGIDQFVKEEIFDPLDMRDTMFETAAAASRLADIKSRNPDDTWGDASFMIPPAHPDRYGMGQALHGTTLDYLKFLRLVLNDGVAPKAGRILSKNVMEMMKQNQIGKLRIPFPKASVIAPISADLDLVPGLNVPCTQTYGFVCNEADVPGRRRAGSLTWAGILNTHYWVDPSSGIAAVLFTQSLPFIESRWQTLYGKFETAVYRELNR